MYSNYKINKIKLKLEKARVTPLDVMVTGVTGAGKSTTLNTLFQKKVAQIGDGVEPETMGVDYYSLNNSVRFWDTPGLGDGVKNDKIHAEKLIDLLYQTYNLDNQNYGLIDMVIVIIEGSNRDMGTTYKLLNEIIVPNFQSDRILVAINQADVGMKGRHWDKNNNIPDAILANYLEEQALSIQQRVKKSTGVNIIKPICYSAECNYNIINFMDLIVENMPIVRRNLISNS